MDVMRLRDLRHAERGSSVVEFAFILPLLLALVMGLIEGGSMFQAWLTLQKSAQMAVRIATTGQGEEEGTRLALIKEEARKLENSLPGTAPTMQVDVCSRAGLDVSAPCVGDDAGDPCQLVEVRTSAAYTPFTPLLASMLPNVVQIAGSERGVNEPWKACP